MRCSRTVSVRGWPQTCTKDAVIKADGKHYCKIHSPEYMAAKQVKSNAKYEADYRRRRRESELRSLADQLLIAVLEGHDVSPTAIRAQYEEIERKAKNEVA